LGDALQHAGIIENDGLIDDLRFVRMPVLKGGMLRVFIYPFKQIESLESEIAKSQKA
jgi:Holliday junction resolvase RusA-like endonuclease